jgi:hypothetical protein
MKKSYLVGGGILIAVILIGFWLHSEFGGTPIRTGTAVINPGNISSSELATNLNGIGIKDSDSSTNVVLRKEVLNIGAGVNYAGFLNATGQTIYVTGAKVNLVANAASVQTASSSFMLDIATSTLEHIADYSNPFASIIDSYTIATSTIGSQQVINSIKNAGTNGVNVVPVANGAYVSVLLSERYNNPGCTGSVCETATSTKRGFDVQVVIDYELYKGF